MNTNEVPKIDLNDNPTQCCPRFHPEDWDELNLVFDRKRFVRACTRSLYFIPLNMGKVMGRTQKKIREAEAELSDGYFMLSRDLSPWKAEHLVLVEKEVPGTEMVDLSGEFLCKVYEGPFKHTPKWIASMNRYVESLGKQAKNHYMFYTTCPKCAKYYGKNYVVAVAEVN